MSSGSYVVVRKGGGQPRDQVGRWAPYESPGGIRKIPAPPDQGRATPGIVDREAPSTEFRTTARGFGSLMRERRA